MHDPNAVAHVVVLPIPRRNTLRLSPGEPRWSFTRRRRTNAENLGEPVYPWWRPAGWTATAAGRRLGLYQHRECSELWSRRQSAETDARLIRWLVAGLAVSADTTEIEMVDRLTGSTVTDDVMPFHARRRLHLMLGYERDSAYRLRNACTGKRHCRAQVHIHGCFADVDGAVCRDPHEHTRTPAETVTR